MEEKELVMEYRKAYDELERATKAKKDAENAFNTIKSKLIEDLEARDATATAKYDGYGRISLLKPELFARVDKAEQDNLFSYLHEIGRDDLFRESVHHKTLTSFAIEMSEQGKPLPDFIKLSYKKVARLTK